MLHIHIDTCTHARETTNHLRNPAAVPQHIITRSELAIKINRTPCLPRSPSQSHLCIIRTTRLTYMSVLSMSTVLILSVCGANALWIDWYA